MVGVPQHLPDAGDLAPRHVGLGRACALMASEGAADEARLRSLRDRLLVRFVEGLTGVTVNGDLERRLRP